MTSIIKVDTIQDQDGNNIINENANTITIGKSGDTVTVAAGASFVGGGISWQSVQTTGFTAVAGNGYFCNTTSAGFTVTLPATPSAGDQVQLVDYAGTFDTNALLIDPNGEDIEGGTDNLALTGEREGVILTYIDSTQGWIATSGINEGTNALSPAPYSIEFLVIAGGGSGGGKNEGGGGGAGGYRTSTQSVGIGTVITVTVGDGGAAIADTGNNGADSSISGSGITTITSNGGGGGGRGQGPNATEGVSGGSGGGGGGETSTQSFSGGTGNSPVTSPSQGNNGGANFIDANYTAGGGGGAGGVGGNGTITTSGAGGNGTASSITGSSVTRAGGGGGGGGASGSTAGTGGTGGGANGSNSGNATAGTANTGGGGGGGGNTGVPNNALGGAGGKGVVILSMPDAKYTGTTTGSPTVATGVSGKTVLTFNGSGSYTA
jgi:hypothetical protein